MKLQNRASDKMEVLYPGNLALLSMFLKNPENDKENINKEDRKKGEAGPECADVLTCGSCHKDFLLADILRFIQHKVICLSSAALQRPKEEPTAENGTDARSSETNTDASSHHDHNANEDTDDCKDDKRKRESDDDTPVRKKPRSTQDAEANTVDTEPARYVCGTCGSIIVSAWSLVQHVQSTHGILIYREPGQPGPVTSQTPSTPPGAPRPSHTSPLASVSSTATTVSGSSGPIPLLDPTKVDLSKVDLTKVDLSKIVPPMSGSTSLPPHPPLLDPTHPFNLLRMPLGDGRTPFPPGLAPPFVRPGHDFRMDQLLQEGLRLNPGLLPPHFGERPPFLDAGLGAPRHTAPTSLSSGGDPNLDFYSQRLRQLAGTTSPTSSTSPRKPEQIPPVSSPTQAPTPSSLNLSQTPTSTRSEANQQIEKPFTCSTCIKSFRWESNLIIHQRIHTGENDFKCPKCDEVICTPQSLRMHMKSHKKSSGESNSPDSSRPQTEDDIDEEEEEEEEEGEEEEEDEQVDDEEEDMEEEEEIIDTSDEEPEIEKIDDEQDDDAPEDLSTSKSTSTPTLQNVTSSTVDINRNRYIKDPKSVVGELMDKFGLANISAYSEAFHQALKESGRIPTLGKDGEKLYPNGMERTIKLREDLAKGAMPPSLDIAHQTLLGSFDNPYEAQKRLAAAGRDGNLYAGLWLPGLAPGANPRDLFPGLPQSEANFLARKMQMEGSLKPSDIPTSLPKPGTSSIHGTPLSLCPSIKKESRRNDTCEYCGKIFKNCSNLTVHRRSHTGEKPYKCDLCSYACAQSSKLTRHMKTHGRMGKDVYRCRFCDMPFSVASTLEKHMRKCVVNQNKKGLFPPLTTGDHDLGYKAMHFTQIIGDETSKSSSIFAPHFNPSAVTANISNDDTGDSSNLSGPGS
ncbi:unnamed protein product [Meganyctiphanes norvegica]|uniref:C2H2-type domain-containing protein n=1 Tax=Meganyctiphanes norvegica TaxID=48144 RepID=A0AAV2RM03_MEGNR